MVSKPLARAVLVMTLGCLLAAPVWAQTQEAPPRDPVGGFQLGILAGVQLRGSASGQFGLALGWFKRSTSNVGFEFEGAFTRGPDGEVYHGLASILRARARSSSLRNLSRP